MLGALPKHPSQRSAGSLSPVSMVPHCPLVAAVCMAKLAQLTQAPQGGGQSPRHPSQGDANTWEQPLPLQGECLAKRGARMVQGQAAGLGSAGNPCPYFQRCVSGPTIPFQEKERTFSPEVMYSQKYPSPFIKGVVKHTWLFMSQIKISEHFGCDNDGAPMIHPFKHIRFTMCLFIQ